MKRLQKEPGFTIVELLIVILVIGILASISVASYLGSRDRARTTRAEANAATVKKAVESYYSKNNVYPTTDSQLRSGLVTVPGEISLLSSENPVLDATTGDGLVAYKYVTTDSDATGACIYYWDFTAKTTSEITLLGTATEATCGTSAGNTVTP